MIKKFLAVVVATLMVLDVGPAPAKAQTTLNTHAVVKVVFDMPAGSLLSQAQSATRYIDLIVKNYTFRYSRACSTSVLEKCITFKMKSMSTLIAASADPIKPGDPKSDWIVSINSRKLPVQYTLGQFYRIFLHELAHAFFWLQHSTNIHDLMYFAVAPPYIKQSFSVATYRHLTYYR